ncbi:MAG: hypothetical protein ACFE75_11765 [Candidatus Hodarchaeota archaeon]
MMSQSRFNPDLYLLSCPFAHVCSLPQTKDTCVSPQYKICPEYQDRLSKMKNPVKVLH